MPSADSSGITPRRKWLPLIRYSHIVSAAVRDVLEIEPLEEAGGAGMTPRQFLLLEFIARDAHHLDDVAKFLRVSPPAATKAVDKLEERGLVTRSGCSDDRRLTLLSCSDRGAALVERYRALQEEAMELAMASFDDDDLSRLAQMLERFSLALVSAENHADELCLRCSGHYDRDCPLRFTPRGCAYLALHSRRDES